MSTRSNIWIKLSNEDSKKYASKYIGIYCYYDGYVEGIGRSLLEYYNSYEDALNLALKGNLSFLDGKNVKAYEEEYSLSDNIFPIGGPDCIYLFKNGKWFYTDNIIKLMFNENVMKDLSSSVDFQNSNDDKGEEINDATEDTYDDIIIKNLKEISDNFDKMHQDLELLIKRVANIDETLTKVFEKI